MKFHPSLVKSTFTSPMGPMTLAATDTGLAGVWFEGQRHHPDLTDCPVNDRHPALVLIKQQLSDYFAGRRNHFDVALDINGGTLFQQSVWRALLKIPPGQTTSYGNIGRQIGNPAAVRAVGAAVGRNPVSIIVPCHRVLGADGSLTGYAGGLDRKTALLKLERSLERSGPAPSRTA
jgi:methylated-DNA-[protein]-cysteine S-methyltransferase